MNRWMMAVLLGGVVASGCDRAPAHQQTSGGTSELAAGDAASPSHAPVTSSRTVPGQPQTRPAVAPARSAPAPAPPAFREVTVPAGTTLRLVLESGIASDTSQVEEIVRATLSRPVSAGGSEVLPQGTEVLGIVTDVDRSGRVKGRAHVAFRFTALRLEGERYDIRTNTVARTSEATKGEDATKIAAGAGVGAALGAVLGGKSGAAKGAAIGGAGGTGVVLATRGKEVRLAPGTAVTTALAAPVVLRLPL